MTDTRKPDAPTFSTGQLQVIAAGKVAMLYPHEAYAIAAQCLAAERERDEAVELLKTVYNDLEIETMRDECSEIGSGHYGRRLEEVRAFLARHEQATTTKEDGK